MITFEDLKECNWKPNDDYRWYSYPVEHISHSNEYFDSEGTIMSFPYYGLHVWNDGGEQHISIIDPDGQCVFKGKIEDITTLKIIMGCIIRHKYKKE